LEPHFKKLGQSIPLGPHARVLVSENWGRRVSAVHARVDAAAPVAERQQPPLPHTGLGFPGRLEAQVRVNEGARVRGTTIVNPYDVVSESGDPIADLPIQSLEQVRQRESEVGFGLGHIARRGGWVQDSWGEAEPAKLVGGEHRIVRELRWRMTQNE